MREHLLLPLDDQSDSIAELERPRVLSGYQVEKMKSKYRRQGFYCCMGVVILVFALTWAVRLTFGV